MANGDLTPHNIAKYEFGRGNINFATDTFRMMIVAGLTVDVDTQDYWDDVSASEISLTGYTANGVVLSNLAYTRNNASDRAEWDFDDVIWASLAAGSVSHAVIVKWTGTASTSMIIGTIELVTQPNGGQYKIAPPSTGGVHVI